MKTISEAQFTEAVYRNYHGEKLTSIAKDFGCGQSTLSELKARRKEEWEQIRQQIRMTEIVRLVFKNIPPQIHTDPQQ
jgi:ribosomal protein S1